MAIYICRYTASFTLLAHCMSRSSFMAFANEIWRNCFMNTLTPINNFISSVMTLCIFSLFCIRIIIPTSILIKKELITMHFNDLSFHSHFISSTWCSTFIGQKIRKVFPSLFKRITSLEDFPTSHSCSSVLLFHGVGLLYKFCRWPQESPSSNPNPKPLYRSWPALQISFKHLRLTFLSSSWMFEQTFHFRL